MSARNEFKVRVEDMADNICQALVSGALCERCIRRLRNWIVSVVRHAPEAVRFAQGVSFYFIPLNQTPTGSGLRGGTQMPGPTVALLQCAEHGRGVPHEVHLRGRRRGAAVGALGPALEEPRELRSRRGSNVQGLTLVHVRAQLEQLQDTFMS
jgi:hypothetical protein